MFDYGEYLQRNKVETTFSILKRKFGFSIKSKDVKNQKVEAMCRIVAYNIDRMLEAGKQVILIFIRNYKGFILAISTKNYLY